jgi:hypothetical protein
MPWFVWPGCVVTMPYARCGTLGHVTRTCGCHWGVARAVLGLAMAGCSHASRCCCSVALLPQPLPYPAALHRCSTQRPHVALLLLIRLHCAAITSPSHPHPLWSCLTVHLGLTPATTAHPAVLVVALPFMSLRRTCRAQPRMRAHWM